jgi:hypothetical protein
LRIHVIFTTLAETKAAIRHAATLSSGLDAEIRLILTPIVPFPLPLDQPPTSMDFSEEQIRQVVGDIEAELEAFVYLCRDSSRTLNAVLPPHSVIVIGVGRWLFSKSRRLACSLRRRGHLVVTPDP